MERIRWEKKMNKQQWDEMYRELCKKKTSEIYSLSEVLQNTRKNIKNIFGLDLTRVEQAGLKKIVLETFSDRDLFAQAVDYNPDRLANENFSPENESAVRFMMFYYDLPRQVAMIFCSKNNSKKILADKKIYQPFLDSLKAKQDEKHHYTN